MGRYRRLFRLLPWTRGEIGREVDEEIRAHLEMRAADLERGGLSPAAARAEAERRFGDVAGARRALRRWGRVRLGRQRRRDRLASVRSDVILAFRRAVAAPVQTVTALATFALAIGLTTAGFTVVDRVLVRGLPFPESDRLVALETRDSVGTGIEYLSENIWLDWAERARSLESMALYSHTPERWSFAQDDGAYNIDGVRVTAGFHGVLGVPLLAGRGLREEDAVAGNVVVTEAFWRGPLGAAPLPVEVELANRRRQVVGVVPAGLEYPLGIEAFMAFEPRRRGDALAGEAYNWLNYRGVGRLAAGSSAEAASAELATIARGVRETRPRAFYLFGALTRPLHEQVVGDARSYLVLLMAAVSVLLLLACANLAGIGVARASVRGQELAIRVSLGAGRRRLVRQLLTEHLLLALVGGALGAALAVVATDAFADRLAGYVPRAEEIAVDTRVLAFAAAVSIAAGVLAGIVPALWASRAPLRQGLGPGRGTASGGRRTPAAPLVVVEVAMALVLLATGGLLLRSFATLLDRDLGYDVEGIVTARANLFGRYPDAQWPDFWRRAGEQLQATPGVALVGFANAAPTDIGGTGFILVEGRDQPGGAAYRVVSDGYFDALGIARLAGRTFAPEDRAGTARVTVINRTMAERYWPDGSALGRRVKAYSMEGGVPERSEWLTVVGIVETIRHDGHIADETSQMYVTMRQVPQSWFVGAMTTVVRGQPGVDAAALAPQVRQAFRALDPGLALEIGTLRDRLADLLSVRSTLVVLLAGFGILSLLLAALGLYGLLAFAVARSMHEMGIRAALGAPRTGLLALVLGRAFRVVAVGAAAGLLAAFWGTRLVHALLVDVDPHDPATFSLALSMLVVVTSAAAFLPAWRASRADPVEALKG